MIQRFFDILFSGSAILLIFPLMIPIILILRLTGEGEIFFLQKRVGKNGRLFDLFKFATMLKNSPNIGTGTVTLKNDPRILPIGNILRKSKINELPQLLNVFIGNMSLIGPRPQTTRCFKAFSEDMQEIIIKVKPGLSGIGPIVFRDEEEILQGNQGNLEFYDQVIGNYKGKVESWYIYHKNTYTYFLLIFLTLWVIIFPKSSIVWKSFKDLPKPPNDLKKYLNYPYL